MSQWLADRLERYVPDAFVFALLGTFVLILAAVAFGTASPSEVFASWGAGFWSLTSFTTQMAMIVIGGYVVAAAPIVARGIRRLARFPKTPKSAVVFVGIVSMIASWLNWGFGLMFGTMLALEVARTTRADYRFLAGASFLGLGSVWAQGLSGSAALQMATPGALPAAVLAIVAGDAEGPSAGIIPLTSTIFLWQSFASIAIELVVVGALLYWIAPAGDRMRTAADLGISLSLPQDESEPKSSTPGEWLEHQPWVSVLVFLVIAVSLVVGAQREKIWTSVITLDRVNLALIGLATLLHRTPHRLMQSVRKAASAVWGILLQFPFYGALAAVLVTSGLSARIAHAFVGASTPGTFYAVVAAYSAALGVLVPSGGAKWVIEAPYVMQAAHTHHAHLGWVVACYDLGEALANLIQPFWMLPTLALFQLKARDVFVVTVPVFLVLTPVVLLLVTLLGLGLAYPM